MTVSLCVVAYNEQSFLENIFNDIIAQDYPHDMMEIILINSASTDSTKEMMLNFEKSNTSFKRVLVLDNPKKTTPSGLNIFLSHAKEDIILKVDAHSRIPNDFISKNVACHNSGEFICGGYRPNIIDESTPWKETLLLVESSMFGSSIASYRRNQDKTYVKTIFHAAYRKEVFDKIGGFNENLIRAEDNEINYRAIQAGYKICFDPSIISYQMTRSTLPKMLKQKYANGYWIALTLFVCPGCISIFHLVPFAFVMSIIFTSILAFFGMPLLAIIMWSMYWILALFMGIKSIIKSKFYITNLLLSILFFLLHVSYGIGSLVGFIKAPFLIKKLRGNK